MTKRSCTRNMPDERHGEDEQRKNRDDDVRKVDGDGRPDMGQTRSKVNDLSMNLELNELEEHKNPMVDGTEDRR